MQAGFLQISQHLGGRRDPSQAFGPEHHPERPDERQAQRACTLPSLRVIEHGGTSAALQDHRNHLRFPGAKPPFDHNGWHAADGYPSSLPAFERPPGGIGLRAREHFLHDGSGQEDSLCQGCEQREMASFGEGNDR
jgi:hypothetical protein